MDLELPLSVVDSPDSAVLPLMPPGKLHCIAAREAPFMALASIRGIKRPPLTKQESTNHEN
ncbi:hypothetical protein [Desulfovulcanus sp.]